MARANDLGHDPIGRLVLRLAIPSMLAQFVNVLYSIVDRMYIGNIPVIGDAALAGAGVCGPIVTLISSFAMLVGVGGGPLMAISMGAGDMAHAKKILANCAMMLAVLSLALTGIMLACREPMLMAFGASEATFPYADEYLTVYVCGSLFAVLSVGLNQFIICQGFSGMGMATVLIGAALNIALDPVFIFGLNMGVKGAAVATVLSQAAGFVFVVCVLLGKKIHVRLSFGGYDWRVMRRVLLYGLSPFVITATDSILLIVLNTVLQRYGGAEMGDTYVTCATIVQSCMQIITMPLVGLTGGTQPILSFNYGAKRIDRIKRTYVWVFSVGLVFTTVMFLVSQFAGGVFVNIFTQNPEQVSLSVWGIRVFTLGVIPLALQYEVVDGFTALGVPKLAVTLSLGRKLLYLLLTILIPLWAGAAGAFYAEPVSDVLCAAVSFTVYLLVIGRLLREREIMPDPTRTL